jgi:NADPH-dependent ferric siderophore reductase
VLTSSPILMTAPDSRPGYRPFRATVSGIRELSPHFVRVTFTGPDLATFGTHGLDQRINLVFPLDGVGLSDCGWDDEHPRDGDWYARWRDLPNELRNPLRVYTVRAVRPLQRELDVDFVVHGVGVAARWLSTAAVGDELVVIGPDALSLDAGSGIDWHPGDARTLLLVGDETAAPAIASILETLPAGRSAHAIIEIPDAADAVPIAAAPGATVTWVARNGGEPGAALVPAVRAWVDARPELAGGAAAPTESLEVSEAREDIEDELWDVPEETAGARFYAWVAGEAGVITGIRRYLVREVGIDRGQVAFMGYWRSGRTQN